MSKTLLSVMIEELETIRLICQNPDCRCVAEFKASKLEGAPYFQCQFCGVVFTEPDNKMLSDFVCSMKLLKNARKKLGVEFIIPAKEQA